MNKSIITLGLLATLSPAFTPNALAQCEVYDLENLTPGTTATNAFPGVTITCPPNSCAGEGGTVLPEIYELTGNPDGPTNVISTREGCPDFSPDHLLLTFDENQSFIQFRIGAGLGNGGEDVTVRWRNEFGTTLGVRGYETASGMGLLVAIEATAAIIRSVEVSGSGVTFEYVDDLAYGENTTPPTVQIDSPAFDTCVCGDSSVSIVGSVADADGNYGCDVGQYRSINADPGDPWTTFGTACNEFTGTLYTLNTTSMAAGRYYVRVTGTDDCDASDSAVTVVRVDRDFGVVRIDGFDGGREDGTLCGTVEVLGGISDSCGVDSWELVARPAGGGESITVATGTNGRECVITEWDTTTLADGDYDLRVTANDTCGHSDDFQVAVTVDNSGFCVCGPDTNGDGVVNFADILLILANWS